VVGVVVGYARLSDRSRRAGVIMEAFDVDGEWWLPESPGEKVPGRLSVSAEGRAELSLIGALRSFMAGGESTTTESGTQVEFSEESIARSGVYARIVGVAGGKSFTLEDCFQTRREGQIFGGLQTERIFVNQVFRGVQFESGEALEFHKIYVWMDWLAYWVRRSGLEESIEFTTSEDGLRQRSATTIVIKPIEPESCQGEAGSTVTLGQSYGVAGDRVRERKLTQDFYFSIAMPGLTDLQTLLTRAGDLQDLVSIGTGRSAAFTSIDLRHPDILWRSPSGQDDHETSIDMFASWQVSNDQPPKLLHQPDMFFSLKDLGGMAGVERWLAMVPRVRSALSRVMATRYSKGMYMSDRLLNCAAALEAYDREKHNDDITYATRLQRSADLAGEPFAELVGDVAAWVQGLKRARNDVAHHNARMVSVSTEFYYLSDSAYWLFIFCLLRDAQAPDAVFTQMVQHQQYRFLKRNLQETGAPGAARRP
jgi:hypothetical protein